MKNQYRIDGDTVTIILNRKTGPPIETVIDTTDLPLADSFKNTWVAVYSPKMKGYYVAGRRENKTVIFHRFLSNAPKGKVVDHINHDTLDNRRSINLRVVTQKENQRNRKGINQNSTSGIPGVSYDKRRNSYEVYTWENGKKRFKGRRKTLKEAEVLLYG